MMLETKELVFFSKYALLKKIVPLRNKQITKFFYKKICINKKEFKLITAHSKMG